VEALTHPQSRQRQYQPRPLEILLGAQPAAGANFSLTSPGELGWRLTAVTFRLTADANAANRAVTVDYDNGNGQLFGSNGLAAVFTANQVPVLSFQANIGAAVSNTALQAFAPLLPVEFARGQKLQINVLNKQAGDQLDRIVIVFERQPYSSS
jgi:hypothetical protein